MFCYLFKGSNDGEVWDSLAEHEDDDSLMEVPHRVTWAIAGYSKPDLENRKGTDSPCYRQFRVIQTGFNSSNTLFLVLSGFELYGALRVITDA